MPSRFGQKARDRNYEAFRREQERLRAEHPGEHLAFCGGKFVAHDANGDALLQRVFEQYPGKSFVMTTRNEPFSALRVARKRS